MNKIYVCHGCHTTAEVNLSMAQEPITGSFLPADIDPPEGWEYTEAIDGTYYWLCDLCATNRMFQIE